MKRIPIVCIAILGLIQSASAMAAENPEQGEAQAQLEAVATAISDIESWLSNANKQHSEELARLREAEVAHSAAIAATTAVAGRVAALREESTALQREQESLLDHKAEQEEILAVLLRAAYMSGDSQALKLLLNGEDLSEGSRMLSYARYLSEYQLGKIEQYEQTLDQLTMVEANRESTLNELESRLQELQREQSALEQLQAERNQAVNALATTITARSSELEQLQLDRAELENLLEEIARAMEGIRSFDDVPPFAEQRGEIKPPIAGPLLSRFGESYGGGSLRRQGIVIGAEMGTVVNAVHAGQVVFANWLRGSGLLVVIDHGEGFMSLYGGNEALAVAAGDWVDAGAVIATSGNGVSNQAGVYFEIRRNGQPQDPSVWLSP
jgi:septal ring factor EnvC (AmiA/AmiB activator)